MKFYVNGVHRKKKKLGLIKWLIKGKATSDTSLKYEILRPDHPLLWQKSCKGFLEEEDLCKDLLAQISTSQSKWRGQLRKQMLRGQFKSLVDPRDDDSSHKRYCVPLLCRREGQPRAPFCWTWKRNQESMLRRKLLKLVRLEEVNWNGDKLWSSSILYCGNHFNATWVVLCFSQSSSPESQGLSVLEKVPDSMVLGEPIRWNCWKLIWFRSAELPW